MFPDTFVAWNPTTGESRKHPVTISFGNGSKWFCGFGYDCLGRDHKLVVVVDTVVTKSNQDVEFNPPVVLDYTLKSTSARYKYFSGRIGFELRIHSAVYSNHHLYWDGKAFDPSCADPNMKREDAVLTYNLQAEVFDYLPLPHNERGVFQGIAAIKDGDLCASFYSFVSPRFMVWVLKEHGMSSPWTLLYSFDDRPHLYRRRPLWDGYRSLLGISSDGYLVVDNAKDVSIIVPVDGAPTAYMSYKTVPKEDERFENVESRSWIYEESLLPPNTEDLGGISPTRQKAVLLNSKSSESWISIYASRLHCARPGD
ncbi:hypothetical protein MLD38_029851 [Melastoma candidum]|uniref:Uncharacterized protein n=1 Tax=Melastoma candidum TaxID=119954 RepID=A0ACB9N510_9MYRT|nr:hypothetical protein MLD38_029851 [Melastoma candidum]